MNTWEEIAQTLSGLPADGRANRFDRYIVKDIPVRRMFHWFQAHWPLVSIAAAVIFVILWQASVIPDEAKDTITSFLEEVKKILDFLPFI